MSAQAPTAHAPRKTDATPVAASVKPSTAAASRVSVRLVLYARGGESRDVPADETITPVQKSVNTSAEPPITASVPALKRRNETMGTKLVARNVETNV